MIYINLHIINQRYSKKKRFYSKKFMFQRSILTSHFHVLYILRKEEEVNFLDLFFIPLHFISIFIDVTHLNKLQQQLFNYNLL